MRSYIKRYRTYLIGTYAASALIFVLLISGHTPAAKAHGALIEVTQKSVEVNATFEDGQPMANAQVLIYAPDDLQTPWEKGETDESGRYQFVPESEQPGTWEVVVRQAGHGGTTSFEVGAAANVLSAGENVSSPVQKWISIAAVIWGFVGTALFFSSRFSAQGDRTPAASSAVGHSSANSPVVAPADPALANSTNGRSPGSKS